jgi:hypothetical protein
MSTQLEDLSAKYATEKQDNDTQIHSLQAELEVSKHELSLAVAISEQLNSTRETQQQNTDIQLQGLEKHINELLATLQQTQANCRDLQQRTHELDERSIQSLQEHTTAVSTLNADLAQKSRIIIELQSALRDKENEQIQETARLDEELDAAHVENGALKDRVVELEMQLRATIAEHEASLASSNVRYTVSCVVE